MTPPRQPPVPENRSSATSTDSAAADDAVVRLLELARDASRDAMPVHGQGVHRLERALEREEGRSSGKLKPLRWLLLPAALAAVGGVCVLRERAITFEVVSGKVSDGGYVSSGSADAMVAFSDQSDLGLAPGTRLRISDLEVHGARVMLEGGSLHVRIHPQPRGHWTLDAGPYIVHVTGTEFDLAWRVDEQTLDLRLEHGSVTVEGPLADGGVKVAHGQHLIASASAGTLSLIDESNPSPPVHAEAPLANAQRVPGGPPVPNTQTAPEVAVATVATSPAMKAAAVHRGGQAAGARAEEPSWRTRVARGDFEGVVDDASRRGIDKVLADAPAADLAALADAARYARRLDLARRALIAQRAHYPDSVQARDAPFFLGSLAQADKNDASELEWYDVYLRESPAGAYASEALGRKMMLLQRLRGAEAARPAAGDYLARFGDGAYAPSARRLLQGQ